jgi:hypothetical protein
LGQLVTRRPSLAEIRREVLATLDGDAWLSPTELEVVAYGQHGGELWYAVALVAERLAADGVLELRVSHGGRVRRFRLAQEGTGGRRARIHPPPRLDAGEGPAGRGTP